MLLKKKNLIVFSVIILATFLVSASNSQFIIKSANGSEVTSDLNNVINILNNKIELQTVSLGSPPDEQFSETYDFGDYEDGQSVDQTSDGGYFIVGSIKTSAGDQDVLVIKTDSEGNVEWWDTHGGSDDDFGVSGEQTSDDGYIVIANTDSYGSGGVDGWIIKLDLDGDKEWDETYGNGNDNEINEGEQTSDDGYILVGTSGTSSDQDLWLIKTDSDGDVSWSKTFDESDSDIGNSVQQTSDGGYIIGGSCLTGITQSKTAAWVIKTNSGGSITWQKKKTGSFLYAQYGVFSVRQCSGGYIAAGYRNWQLDWADFDYWLWKLTSSGGTSWDKYISSSDDIEMLFCVRPTEDGGFITVGFSIDTGNFRVIKAYSNGDQDWYINYGGSDIDIGNEVEQVFDDGYIIIGMTKSYGEGDGDVWAIRLEGGNQAPNTPGTPSGPTTLSPDEEGQYCTSATDPDGDNVQYRFDWDADGVHDYSVWTDLTSSGTQECMDHSWNDVGTYIIKAQARDINGHKSGWSNGLNLIVTNPPYEPSNPSPTNGSVNVDLDADLNWTGGDPDGDTVTYDVYFGTSSPPPKVITNQSETTYDPGTMIHATMYYWRIKSWDEYGASTLGPIWSFTTKENNPPNTPSNPDPYDGETDVELDANLSWTCSDPDGDDLTYDVYFGDYSPPPLVSSGQSNTTYNPEMEYNTTYYWQIIAWDEYDASTSGPIWNFTTEGFINNPPNQPSDPIPEDGKIDVNIDTILAWNCSDPDGDPLVYDVYLEKNNSNPDVLVSDDQTENTYDPEDLEYESVYYWKIVAKDNHNAITEGPIWSFTTGGSIPDLNCDGSLSWTGVPIGKTVTGDFIVENIGNPASHLDWEVYDWPDWGNWTFTPLNGEDLTPENGQITVEVEVIAPNEKNQEFTGEVKIVNCEDSNDFDIIPVSLSTPKNKPYIHNFPLLNWLLERFPNALPILRQLLGLLNQI